MSLKELLEINHLPAKQYIHKINGYIVYADESMNMRKVRIKDSTKEELKYKFFVLGGIEVPQSVDLNDLKKEFEKDNFPKEEVKYKYFSYDNSDFKVVLKSRRINKLFKYLLRNKIYIHITVLNYWYWAISDIIDSLMKDEPFDINDNRELKMGLYEALMSKYDEMYDLFYEYDFPSIPHGKERDFISKIQYILKKVIDKVFLEGDEEYDSIKRLINIIDRKLPNITSLVLIQDDIPGEIINSLTNVYIQKASLYFENGVIFDREETIENELSKISSNYLEELNCKFVNSKECFGVQISDVVVGFTARLFKLISNYEEYKVFSDNLKTGCIELENLALFKELLNSSIEFYPFNYTRIISFYQDATFFRVLEFAKYFYYY